MELLISQKSSISSTTGGYEKIVLSQAKGDGGALGRQRQTDLCEFKTSLVYRVSSRTARAVTQRNTALKYQKRKSFCLPKEKSFP